MIRETILILSTLALSAALGFSDDDLEVLWEDAYSPSFVITGFGSSGSNHVQDDFELETSAVLKALECWGIFRDGGNPQPFEVTLRYDHYGIPGGTYWGEYVTDVTETDTGQDYAGYDVMLIRLSLDEGHYVHIEATTPFWLEIYWTSHPFTWLARESGNVHVNWEEYPDSVFFRILGTPDDTDVEAASWGEIKAGYSD